MDTSKYTKEERRGAKKVTRHPLYQLQKGRANHNETLFRAAQRELVKLRAEVAELKAPKKGASS